MTKRQATEQITREAFHEEVSDDDEQRPVQASSSVLATRKILKPRRKLGDGNGSTTKSTFSIPSTSSFQFNPSTKSAPTATPLKANDDANKIRALNLNFVNKINEFNKENAIADLTPIAEKYINYYKEIKSGSAQGGPTSSAPATAPASKNQDKIQEDQSSSDSEADEKDQTKEVKVEGPKFTLTQKPSSSSSSSPFTFDPKKIAKLNAKDSDDSDDDVPIKGPTFNFNKPIQDSVFKLKGATDSGNNASSETNKPASSFTFGQQSTPSTTGSAPTSGFNFGAKPVENSTNVQSTSSTNTSGPFNFASSQAASGTTPLQKPSSAFSFGANTNQNSTSATTGSVFSGFGGDTNSSPKPSFNFGAKQENPSVGSENATNAVSGGTTSGINKQIESNTSKSPFQFGASTTSESKGFGTPFSSNLFNQNKKSTDGSDSGNKPVFAFGQKTGASATTPTNNLFGGTKPDTAPASNPFGGLGTTGFQWGQKKDTGKEDEKVEADKVEEHEVEGNFTPVAQMNEKKEVHSGEENEETKFTIRAKLMEFDSSNTSNPYINKGLGELKVLRNTDTSKSRIVIRADGSLRVLLNTLLSKDVSYSSMGNGSLVRIPVFSSDNKIETFVVKVKTADDGKELLKTIEELKS
ncbi:hypothetical protein KGF57_001485 [Candida theae]|uniref:RanBD1 domain-containing protein n=1 Tax=Candida theae TaxID=1198502 RepID=A0AAD5FZM5_9ASCO|nr:uncharacterized protein KGF57_001485 [Candida theae]KAI5962040.1 hypothetical protein KGF57_001485 [Candida theae]